MVTQQKNSPRFYFALTLFAASVISALAISYLSNKSAEYWVIARAVPAGVAISSADLSRGKATINIGKSTYLRTSRSPLGAIALRQLQPGEILQASALTNDLRHLSTEFVSLSIRSSDFPGGTSIGDAIHIYQVHDSRNGEQVIAPTLIVRAAPITAINQKGANFGSDLSITVAIQAEDLVPLLAATSSGRLVVARSNG
jgi:hypothetical protein